MCGYTFKQISNLLEENGWIYKRQKGSHKIYCKIGYINNIAIPFNREEICRPMAKRILKEAGISYQ